LIDIGQYFFGSTVDLPVGPGNVENIAGMEITKHPDWLTLKILCIAHYGEGGVLGVPNLKKSFGMVFANL
jgi:hypothetical protein